MWKPKYALRFTFPAMYSSLLTSVQASSALGNIICPLVEIEAPLSAIGRNRVLHFQRETYS